MLNHLRRIGVSPADLACHDSIESRKLLELDRAPQYLSILFYDDMRFLPRLNAISNVLALPRSVPRPRNALFILHRSARASSTMEYSNWSHEDLVKRVAKLESELRAQNEKSESSKSQIVNIMLIVVQTLISPPSGLSIFRASSSNTNQETQILLEEENTLRSQQIHHPPHRAQIRLPRRPLQRLRTPHQQQHSPAHH